MNVTPQMIEVAAKAIYDADSPGGNLTWKQAKARDAEFCGNSFYVPITQFPYRAARAALEAALCAL